MDLLLPAYLRPHQLHRPLATAAYGSDPVARAAKPPLVLLRRNLTEVTGPLLGSDRVRDGDDDLTAQHNGEPQGQRHLVLGRVLDSDGAPVPQTLVEVWQANAGRRYRH